MTNTFLHCPPSSVQYVVEQKFQFHARFVTKPNSMAHLANGGTGQAPNTHCEVRYLGTWVLGQFNVSVAQMSPGWLM